MRQAAPAPPGNGDTPTRRQRDPATATRVAVLRTIARGLTPGGRNKPIRGRAESGRECDKPEARHNCLFPLLFVPHRPREVTPLPMIPKGANPCSRRAFHRWTGIRPCDLVTFPRPFRCRGAGNQVFEREVRAINLALQTGKSGLFPHNLPSSGRRSSGVLANLHGRGSWQASRLALPLYFVDLTSPRESVTGNPRQGNRLAPEQMYGALVWSARTGAFCPACFSRHCARRMPERCLALGSGYPPELRST